MEELYKNYFDSMPCYLTVQDKDFHLIDANQKFQKEFGKIDGRYCYQIYKHRSEKCEVCPVEKTFRDGLPHSSREQVTNLDGKIVSVLVNTTPIFDDNGKIKSVMEMSTDVTEMTQLQHQLKFSQEKYRQLFEEVPCFISIQDRDLRIVEANRLHREAFGTSYGKKCYEAYKHRSTACEPCIVQQTFKDGDVHVHEEVVTSKDNNRMNVMVVTAPLRYENNNINQVVEMSVDITKIRQLQDKLTSVGMLIGTISHGIKGLLNALDGGIYLVNTGLKKDDRDRIDQGWEIASRNIRRIRSMVMDILYYAKDREPEWETINIEEMVSDICQMMQDRNLKFQVTFDCNIDKDIGNFEADRQAIRSLLINLVENSIDACRIDKKKSDHNIAIGVSGTKENVIFQILDDGIGMDQETREKALSLFFSSKGAGGTGLGLFIANKIAQSHGGQIDIQSEEEIGSKFTVSMKRKRPEILQNLIESDLVN